MPEISIELLRRLVAEADRAAPLECCGLLLGQGARIETIESARNIAADPHRRFEIDPAALFAAYRAERSGGLQLIGYYHSHPSGHPAPSPRDCEHASGDRRVWAIIAGGEVGFWRDMDGSFEALSCRLVDG
ncbi:MAG: M67 family metallopeptidase [Novosphingobium sp.]